MFFQGEEFLYIVPLLGLFAAAAFRIMPSLARIMNSVQGILYNRAAVDAVFEEFNQKSSQNNINKESLKKILFSKEIVLKKVNFKYPDSDKIILRDISLKIKNGTSIGLIGESGIGKTTLINIILGLMKPTNGSIFRQIQDNINNR